MSHIKISGPPMGFYPSNKGSLLSLMESFEEEFHSLSLPKTQSPIRGLVVPHAGLVFSGFTAYCAYRLLSQSITTPDPLFIIFAPSHHSLFQGMVTAFNSVFQTPFGRIATDDTLLERFLTQPWLEDNASLHQQEHSLQVQIPFLQYCFKSGTSIRLLPFLVSGNHSSGHWVKIFDDFLSTLPADEKPIFIASSDLYHGLSYEEAVATDEKTVEGILSDNSMNFWENCRSNTYMACGDLPVFAVKYIAEKQGFNKPRLVHQTNSNDITGERGGYVVGYSSVIFSE